MSLLPDRAPVPTRRQVIGAMPAALALMGSTAAAAVTVTNNPSAFGAFRWRAGLPEFVYNGVGEAPARHFHMIGNRRIKMQVSQRGEVGLYDPHEAMRWLIAPQAGGTGGHSQITEGAVEAESALIWGSTFGLWPKGPAPERIFGVNRFEIAASHHGLTLRRTVLMPEGEAPYLLIKVDLSLDASSAARSVTHCEIWPLEPRFLKTFQSEKAREAATARVTYQIAKSANTIVAREEFGTTPGTNGTPKALSLQAHAPLSAATEMVALKSEGRVHPSLCAKSVLTLQPGQTKSLYFTLGLEGFAPDKPVPVLFSELARVIRCRLPTAHSALAPQAELEIPWHAAALVAGLSTDQGLPGHSLNQGGIYAYGLGSNASARDSLQHALPLVYFEPELALSVLKNTCAWGSPDGDLPYALKDDKSPYTSLLRPSDLNLWALWLATEYAAATNDLAAFAAPQPYHPVYGASPVSLKAHLIQQFRFFVDKVGRGERGHVRILNADWNDMALGPATATNRQEREAMILSGSSVLNSAMASYVLNIFAGLMTRLGEGAVADEARTQALDLKLKVAEAWNGRFFDRAYRPGGGVMGRDRCWLEVQPWAILCGAATREQAKSLLKLIDEGHRRDSPLGARIIWPPDPKASRAGEGTIGGIWYSINMTLIWAAASIDPNMAWDEWRRMTLQAHQQAYPTIFEGTLAGPDSWNAPEASRPGHTWATPAFAMQDYPVSNMHAHAQPILAYLRLLGVCPDETGSLSRRPPEAAISGWFDSQTFRVGAVGRFRLE
jgi:hypothetical protein